MKPEDLLEVRRRFLKDFEFYAEKAIKIRTKKSEIVPLVLNRVQQRFVKAILQQLEETGRIRVKVLKARQQGLSTVITAFMYWWLSQHKAQKGVVVTHKADSTDALFGMYHRIHNNVPDMLRPNTSYRSKRQLFFDRLDTGIIVATAGGDAIARGETITHAHLSERAFWPKATAIENYNGLMQAIPDAPNTAVFDESTANGFNDFYNGWKEAVSGRSGYMPFFSPWFESDEYRTEALPDFERTLEENDIAAAALRDYGITLTNDQFAWRRKKISDTGRDLFMQEYPANPNEAFLASGRPVFDPIYLTPLLEKAPEPICKMAVEEGVLREHSRGELAVYHKVDPSQTYTIGADVAMGVRGGDYSEAHVLDGDKRQVAVWRGHIQPDAFAHVLAALGRYYNNAFIAPERNHHGLLTCVRLRNDIGYPHVYLDVTEGQISDRDSINIGFLTNVKTKPLIIDRLRAVLRDAEIQINDRETLEQMKTFVVTETGSMEAEEGKHDDAVMALAIANHVHVRRWTPVTVSDEYYVDAI